MRAILIGNYGVGNIGDEALQKYFLAHFPEMEWTVVSAHPSKSQEIPRLPLGVRSLFRPWWKTLWTMLRCDVVVFGGGSLFTDAESVFACILWWWHGFIARTVFRTPIVLAFQGLGPVSSLTGKLTLQWVLRRSVYVSVRDRLSLERMRLLFPNLSTKIVLSFDPVIALLEPKNEKRTHKLIIIPRTNSSPDFQEEVENSVRSAHWHSVDILLLQPSTEQGIARYLEMLLHRQGIRPAIVSIHDVRELANHMDGELVITQRYHGAIAALAAGIPFIAVPQKPGDKLDAIAGMDREVAMGLVERGEQSLRECFGLIT